MENDEFIEIIEMKYILLKNNSEYLLEPQFISKENDTSIRNNF